MQTQIVHILLQFGISSPCYVNTQYRELPDLTQKYVLLQAKNYVSKEVIEPELTWEENIGSNVVKSVTPLPTHEKSF
jgi:hypothetical protein